MGVCDTPFGGARLRCLAAVTGLLLATACQEPLLHDLNERQANRMRVLLAEKGIAAEKVREGEGWTLTVAGSEVQRALTALEHRRVLTDERSARPEPRSGFIQSKAERAHFLERDLSWGIARTLERLPEVLEARVHLRLRPQPLFSLERDALGDSASVLLLVGSQSAVDEGAIQKLIAGASGISADRVTVVLSAAKRDADSERLPPQRTGTDVSAETSPRPGQRIKAQHGGPVQGLFLPYPKVLRFAAPAAGVALLVLLLARPRRTKEQAPVEVLYPIESNADERAG